MRHKETSSFENLATPAELLALTKQIKEVIPKQGNVVLRIVEYFSQNENMPVSLATLYNAVGFQAEVTDIYRRFREVYAKLVEAGYPIPTIRFGVVKEDRHRTGPRKNYRATIWHNRVALIRT